MQLLLIFQLFSESAVTLVTLLKGRLPAGEKNIAQLAQKREQSPAGLPLVSDEQRFALAITDVVTQLQIVSEWKEGTARLGDNYYPDKDVILASRRRVTAAQLSPVSSESFFSMLQFKWQLIFLISLN
ncbi:hypothetical protein Y1Q_0009344 [Alligator mississippiensis]|uniref:Uncharacterized protein n=1 Tax=Alligator mississippiensis TaxID=8496 RepID=A0A151N7F1_ALLMI|nr:hypothetical protein Y1Q_0009344 [Alligator mississippiensis]